VIKYTYRVLTSEMEKGGYIMAVLFIVALVAWYIGVDKWVTLRRFSMARGRFMESMRAGGQPGTPPRTGIEPLDLLWEQIALCRSRAPGACAFPLVFREFLIAAVPILERHFSTLAAWISIAPLLGLLGTVIGMVETFRVITTYGLGNPNLTAEGISIALLTTQWGLTVAFPLMLLHNYLSGRMRAIKSQLLKDGEELMDILAAPVARASENGHV